MAIEPPKKTTNDQIIDLISKGIESVPAGRAIIAIIETFFTKPFVRRQQHFINELCDVVNKIEEDGITINELMNNEEFIDLVIQASRIAMENHQQEKLNALKNAIYNSTQDDSPNFTFKTIFLNYIGTFTTWHIKILILFNDPVPWLNKNNITLPRINWTSSVGEILELAYPELKGQSALVKTIWNDLYSKDLLTGDSKLLVMGRNPDGAISKRTTKTGEDFVTFISDK